MAAYISVPRDLTRVKSNGGNTLATLGMMILMLPLFFLAMYEKNGQPLEKFLNHYIQARFIRPKVRPYRTANYFALLQQQAELEQEVDAIVSLSSKEKG